MCTNDIKLNPYPYQNPSQLKMDYFEIKIKTQDNLTLFGWFIYHPESVENGKKPTFIYFHENAGNIGFRLPFAKFLHDNLKVNILVVGYRGYGYSEGIPTEEGLMLDAESIVNIVLQKNDKMLDKYINIDEIYIFGRSLGGAVAVYIANKFNPKIRGLILENTFSSMGDMVDHLFPYFKYFKNFLLKNKWPSKDRIKNIKLPVLFFSSEHDELVPSLHMTNLYELSNNALFKQKHIIKGGTHNESWQRDPDVYIQQIKDFMKKCGTEEVPENEIEDESNKNQTINTINDNEIINKDEETILLNKKYD